MSEAVKGEHVMQNIQTVLNLRRLGQTVQVVAPTVLRLWPLVCFIVHLTITLNTDPRSLSLAMCTYPIFGQQVLYSIQTFILSETELG